ncbi:hypothetical protein BVRB_4g084330 [Beta vulgaris subsp. vulgaris]|nr:hypothetical protein BVRB_4g084330 [Beta vulgaris subsp. vulgaris]
MEVVGSSSVNFRFLGLGFVVVVSWFQWVVVQWMELVVRREIVQIWMINK